MKTRPKSVTVISWILIGGIGLSLLAKILRLIIPPDPAVRELMARSLIPIPVQYIISYVGLAVLITCGVAMLKAHNWARYLYAIWGAFNIVVGLAAFPATKLILIPGILVYALFVFLLFRSEASRYFTERAEPSDGANAALGAPRSSS